MLIDTSQEYLEACWYIREAFLDELYVCVKANAPAENKPFFNIQIRVSNLTQPVNGTIRSRTQENLC